MALGTATEPLEMIGIGCEVRNPRIHHSPCPLQQLREAVTLMRVAWSFEHQP
jgi:hypothetical protein